MNVVEKYNLSEIFRLDPVAERIIKESSPKEMFVQTDIYLNLLESIISQQISAKAAKSVFDKFCNIFPDKYPQANLILEYPVEIIQKSRLTFKKVDYLKNLAQFAIDNNMNYDYINNLSDNDIIKYLIQIKGIGKWTVEMILIFALNRLDVFPLDDLVIQRNIKQLYNVESSGRELRKTLIGISDKWKPYRSIFSRYLWDWQQPLNF